MINDYNFVVRGEGGTKSILVKSTAFNYAFFFIFLFPLRFFGRYFATSNVFNAMIWV